MTDLRRFSSPDGLLAIALFLALVVGLVVVPRLVPADSGVVSAAAAQGFNTDAAFWTLLAWAALTLSVFGLRGMSGRGANETAVKPNEGLSTNESWSGRLDWREIAAVFIVFALAYFPAFLARYGPFVEDTTFLVALGRMACGDVPYRDFAFLYGPLMLYPVWTWLQAFGFSMSAYYACLGLAEGAQFALLIGVLQRLIPDRRRRYVVFVTLLPFLFNNLLGFNYNALRWLAPTLVIIMVAVRPWDRRVIWLSAVLLGLQLGYSHEYALAALLALIAMHGVLVLRREARTGVVIAAATVVGTGMVWLLATLLVLRGALPAYIEHATQIMKMMSGGHAGFRFFWTANSLALFGLLAIACVAVGRGLFGARVRVLDSGDRLLVAALVFALVALKSGLTRADLWHLNPPFLPLLFAFLLPLPASALALTATERRLAGSLIVVGALTFLVGIAPTGSLYVVSYIRGLRDTVAGSPKGMSGVVTRTYSIELERTHPRAQVVALGQYLAEAERRDRPVLFYGRAWDLPPRIGVCPAHYKLDDLMYTEFSRPEVDYLRLHADALVVARADDYRRLYELADPDGPPPVQPMTPTKQLGRWLSTVHYDSAETEARLQDETRTRLTGDYVRANYVLDREFGDLVVLTRSASEVVRGAEAGSHDGPSTYPDAVHSTYRPPGRDRRRWSGIEVRGHFHPERLE